MLPPSLLCFLGKAGGVDAYARVGAGGDGAGIVAGGERERKGAAIDLDERCLRCDGDAGDGGSKVGELQLCADGGVFF